MARAYSLVSELREEIENNTLDLERCKATIKTKKFQSGTTITELAVRHFPQELSLEMFEALYKKYFVASCIKSYSQEQKEYIFEKYIKTGEYTPQYVKDDLILLEGISYKKLAPFKDKGDVFLCAYLLDAPVEEKMEYYKKENLVWDCREVLAKTLPLEKARFYLQDNDFDVVIAVLERLPKNEVKKYLNHNKSGVVKRALELLPEEDFYLVESMDIEELTAGAIEILAERLSSEKLHYLIKEDFILGTDNLIRVIKRYPVENIFDLLPSVLYRGDWEVSDAFFDRIPKEEYHRLLGTSFNSRVAETLEGKDLLDYACGRPLLGTDKVIRPLFNILKEAYKSFTDDELISCCVFPTEVLLETLVERGLSSRLVDMIPHLDKVGDTEGILREMTREVPPSQLHLVEDTQELKDSPHLRGHLLARKNTKDYKLKTGLSKSLFKVLYMRGGEEVEAVFCYSCYKSLLREGTIIPHQVNQVVGEQECFECKGEDTPIKTLENLISNYGKPPELNIPKVS